MQSGVVRAVSGSRSYSFPFPPPSLLSRLPAQRDNWCRRRSGRRGRFSSPPLPFSFLSSIACLDRGQPEGGSFQATRAALDLLDHVVLYLPSFPRSKVSAVLQTHRSVPTSFFFFLSSSHGSGVLEVDHLRVGRRAPPGRFPFSPSPPSCCRCGQRKGSEASILRTARPYVPFIQLPGACERLDQVAVAFSYLFYDLRVSVALEGETFLFELPEPCVLVFDSAVLPLLPSFPPPYVGWALASVAVRGPAGCCSYALWQPGLAGPLAGIATFFATPVQRRPAGLMS